MDINEMKKELFYEPKHAMEIVDAATVKAADDFCEGYKIRYSHNYASSIIPGIENWFEQ